MGGVIGPEQGKKIIEGVEMMRQAASAMRDAPAPQSAGEMRAAVLLVADDWDFIALRFEEGAASGDPGRMQPGMEREKTVWVHHNVFMDALGRAMEAVCHE